MDFNKKMLLPALFPNRFKQISLQKFAQLEVQMPFGLESQVLRKGSSFTDVSFLTARRCEALAGRAKREIWFSEGFISDEAFEGAEAWDLDFRQRQSPEQRLSALVAIRRDVDKVMKGRLSNEKAAGKG